MDTIIFYDLGWHVSLDINDELSEEQREKVKRDFIHSYTFGISPMDLFHLPIDHIEDPFETGVKNTVFEIESRHMIKDPRVIVITWRKYLLSLKKSDKAKSLQRLSEWIESYYVFRQSDDTWNRAKIPASDGRKLMKIYRGWIQDMSDIDFPTPMGSNKSMNPVEIEGYYNELGLRYYRRYLHLPDILITERNSAKRICESLISKGKLTESNFNKKWDSILKYINRYKDKERSPYQNRLIKMRKKKHYGL